MPVFSSRERSAVNSHIYTSLIFVLDQDEALAFYSRQILLDLGVRDLFGNRIRVGQIREA